jgi:hypothetical protein
VTPLAAAGSSAIARLLAADESLAVVRGAEAAAAGLAGGNRTDPARRVVVRGPAARIAVGEGLARTGRDVVTVVDGTEGWDPELGWASGHVLVAVDPAPAAAHPGVATRLTRGFVNRVPGLTVVQPAWPADVEPLLTATLDDPGPALVRLHGGDAPGVPPAARPVLGTPRVLRPGPAGLLVGAGMTVPLLAAAAHLLAGRGVRLMTVEVHSADGAVADRLGLLDDRVLLGQADAARELDAAPSVAALDAVSTERLPAAADAPALAEAVLSRLRI